MLQMFFCGIWCVLYCPLVVWKANILTEGGNILLEKNIHIRIAETTSLFLFFPSGSWMHALARKILL